MYRVKTNRSPTRNILVKICLLYLASQLGKNISKLSLVELEYFLAIIVKGHLPLKIQITIPSIMTAKIAAHVYRLIWFVIPQYKV